MKNIFRFLMAAVIFFGAVSCAKEDISSSLAGEEVTVTFTANLPDLGTRAYGDAKHIDILYYNVYQHGQEEKLKISGYCDKLVDGKFFVNIEMIKGMTYDIVFWAQNKDCGCYDLVGKVLTINYEDAVANDENRDAFLATLTDFDPSSAAHPRIVELKRPFAQLNVATSDYETIKKNGIYLTKVDDVNENIDNITSDLKITTQVDTKFNLFTNKAVPGFEKQTVTFAPSKMPCTSTSEETLNNYAGYTYLSMNYIFVLGDRETVDVEYNFTGNRPTATDNTKFPFTKVVIPSVPLQRNYRTNILGKLLTQTADFEVVLEKEFDGAKEVAIWDGVATEEPVINGNIYEVYNAAQLAHIANLVNGTLTREAVAANDLTGKTVKLMNDIYLANEEWTPIGNIHPKHFKGTFDGNGKTIYGLKITEHNGAHPKGLFGIVSGTPTVRNLTIDGATVAMKNDHTDDFYAAGLIGTFYGNLTVEGVTVKNSTFVGNNKVAGLLAHDGVCSSLNINNCHILNCNISSANLTDGGNVGGLLGLFQGAANGEFKITNSSVKESTIVGINPYNNGKRANGQFVACVSSKENQTLVIENCVVEGNNFTETIDGINPVTYVGPYDNLFVGGERNDYTELPGSVVIDGLPYPHTKVATWAEFDAAITNNKSYLILTADIDFGSTQLAITGENQVVDLGGHTLTTANIYGGITLKNGASIKNGTINHTGNTAAIKAWNVESIENVTINVTPTDGKVKGGIVIQSGADNHIALIKNVTITGATNGIETYNCGWTDNTPAIGAMENVNINATDTGILLSAHIGKATNCNIKGANHGINMHLKGEYRVGIELENCTVEGTNASIWGHDEKGKSNTNNCSLTLTYDAATTLTGPFIWDFEDECKSVVTLNKPE